MDLKVIINHVEKHKGFIIDTIRFNDKKDIEVVMAPDCRTKPTCPCCGGLATLYGTLNERRYRYLPILGIAVFFLYTARRLKCAKCGVRVENIPWADGKRRITISFAWYLSEWAKVLSWTEVARRFHVSWDVVFTSVEMAVNWGRANMTMDGITAIGIDEVYLMKGKFFTLVYQINDGAKRLLWIAEDRKEESLRDFFSWLGKERSAAIEIACTDMWKPFLTVITQCIPNALNILDRFHVKAKLNKAIDEIRSKEVKELAKKGYEPVLKRARYCLLKRKENLTDWQASNLKFLLTLNLKCVRAHLLVEEFDFFWTYTSSTWAGKFLNSWCTTAMRSKLEPIKKVVRTIRDHRSLLLNYFEAKNKIALGAVEGLNNKLKVTLRSNYGFSSPEVLKIACYHKLGNLPVPDIANRFF